MAGTHMREPQVRHRPGAAGTQGRSGSGRRLIAVLLAVLGLLSAGAAAPAAAAELTVRGTVTSDTGQPVAGVRITVEGTGLSRTATTSASGEWEVEVGKAGTYVVRIDTASLPPGQSLRDPAKTELTVTLFSTSKTVQFPLGQPAEAESTGDQALQLLVDGLVFGLIIALSGVGLSLIFGTTGLTNFAHGDLMTLGALAALVFNNYLGLPFVLAAALALLVAAAAGWAQDRGLWRPLRRRGTSLIAMLVVSIGLGITARYVFLFFFGGGTQQYDDYAGQAGLEFGPVSITPKSLIAAAVAVVALAATIAWLLGTRMGKASRAISDNPALASASGIDVERVINRVWIIGTTLAALGGIMYSLNTGVNWLQGFQILLLVFAGVVLGGLGTAFGALVGSLLVGVLLQVSTLVVPPELKYVGALALLILILLIRPQGILGRAERVG